MDFDDDEQPQEDPKHFWVPDDTKVVWSFASSPQFPGYVRACCKHPHFGDLYFMLDMEQLAEFNRLGMLHCMRFAG